MATKDKRMITVFTGHETHVDLEKLKERWGKNKKFAQGYAKEILLALSHYPELENTSIEFSFTESGHPMSARPKPFAFFLPAHKRTFNVCISTKISASKEPVLLRNLPFQLRVLQSAHELGHIVDYMSQSPAKLIGSILSYPFSGMKRNMEQTADRQAINHGFGKQVIEFSELIYELKRKYPGEKHYQEYHKFYMTPAEAKAYMEKHPLYQE